MPYRLCHSRCSAPARFRACCEGGQAALLSHCRTRRGAQPPHATLSMDTSGPLNTDGSFMSFHVYRCSVLPWYDSSENLDAHQSRTSALRRIMRVRCAGVKILATTDALGEIQVGG